MRFVPLQAGKLLRGKKRPTKYQVAYKGSLSDELSLDLRVVRIGSLKAKPFDMCVISRQGFQFKIRRESRKAIVFTSPLLVRNEYALQDICRGRACCLVQELAPKRRTLHTLCCLVCKSSYHAPWSIRNGAKFKFNAKIDQTNQNVWRDIASSVFRIE